jgi:hypothetical protein
MIDTSLEELLSSNEWLARFILHKNYIRQNLTVRPDAFIPHPWADLSVTRHLQLSEKQLWTLGRCVAQPSAKTVYGRADFQVAVADRLNLKVTSNAQLNNPNHAIITNWPADKPSQKAMAQEIAAHVGLAKIAPSEDCIDKNT